MPKPVDLRPTTDQLTRIISRISDDDLGGPTPSPERTVGDLIDPCLGLSVAFTAAAQKADVPMLDQPPPRPLAANLPPDWRTMLPQRLDALAEAWRQPGAIEGLTKAGGVTMPAQA